MTHSTAPSIDFTEAEDFGAEFTPELRDQEERLREQLGAPANRPG